MFASRSLALLTQLLSKCFARIAQVNKEGRADEAMVRLSFMEHLLLHALGTVRVMQSRIEQEASSSGNELTVAEFRAELDLLPTAEVDS